MLNKGTALRSQLYNLYTLYKWLTLTHVWEFGNIINYNAYFSDNDTTMSVYNKNISNSFGTYGMKKQST